MSAVVPYTRLPRPTLWLLRGEDEVRSFYLSKNPITNEEYEAFDPGHERGDSSPGDHHPVVGVSYDEASAYCEWYANASNKDFRLLSEVEWEVACRADSEGRFFWGDAPGDGDPFVWDSVTSGGSCREVETSRANGFGLYDMLGNVWEWTSSRVARGGSFRSERTELTCDARLELDSDARRDDLGFRIARFL